MSYQDDSKKSLLSSALAVVTRIDFLQLFAVAGLLTIGVLFIYGTGQQVGEKGALLWKKQLIWAGMGFIIWAYMAFFFDYRKLVVFVPFIYAACLIGLILVLMLGVELNGARRWFSFAGISIQPSEFAKFGVLLMAAWILSIKEFDVNKLHHLALLGIVCGVPFLLIVVEPDLGTSIVFIPMICSMVFAAGLKWKWIFLGLFLSVAAVPAIYPFLKEYQKERIQVFLDPERDPENRGWNSLQSQLAVGSGGAFGKGFMRGTQNTLGFLPKNVSYTDFIYSVIAEESGFVGSVAVVFLYFLLIVSALRAAVFAPDNFGRYIAVGIAGVFFVHSFVNIGMTIKIMPITGIPLPLLSYGGTFMIVIMAFLGFIQSIYSRRQNIW
ncbi:MAG TPA: rod shape-determining protein RodA [Lentisphaeria bacterium]|nr:MAG: rod shape-determining protein RodA [Lentisphaerae bacterium GWF2_50_93]HCE43842.1 rod shape-determining protein RodA [Lentisphaeria bacterium]